VGPGEGIADITKVIQTAVAPVFLLLAVGSVLGVLTNRLARIVDRARVLDRELLGAEDHRRIASLQGDLHVLQRRAGLVNRSITLAVVCALLVCAVIVLLFVDAVYRVDNSRLIALCFVLAMVAFIAALAGFLRETYLATSALRFGTRRAPPA
jgi:hypothetical protein